MTEVRLGRAAHEITKTWKGKSASGREPLQYMWKCQRGCVRLWEAGITYGSGGHWGTKGVTQLSASGWKASVGNCTIQESVDISPIGQPAEPS